jgi:hypothetical protein
VQERPAAGSVAVAEIEKEPHGGSRRDEAYRAAFRKAKRQGQPASPLPPGERWKRRLPRVCW